MTPRLAFPVSNPGVRLRALYEVFLARFFENESTLERTDLRRSFFWLIGFLAAPGMCWAVWQMFRWDLIARFYGAEALHTAVLFDKALYLQLTYVAIGLIAAMAWPSLVLDRRDGLILGPLPIRPRTIVIAKAAALGAYIGMLGAGMHLGSAVVFGTLLSGGPFSVWRGVLGHFVAGMALSTFVFVSAAALASAALAVLGPRRFARASAGLQILTTMAVTAGLILLPPVTAAAAGTLGDRGGARAEWILLTPTIWFLGLYESIAGTTLPVMRELAMRAGLALLTSAGLFAVTYPLAARRILASVTAATGGSTRRRRRATGDVMMSRLSRLPPVRGVLQFALLTCSRAQQQRLIIAIGAGISLTVAVPILLSALSPASPGAGRPMTVPLIAVGPACMFLMAAALRVALAMPAELAARWIFATVPSPALAGRRAARRVMWMLAVLPGVLVTATIATWVWDLRAGATAGVAVALFGATLVDVHLWGFAGVPCARLLAPGEAQLHARWPWYLGGLYLTVIALPRLIVTLQSIDRLLWILPGLAILAALVRRGSDGAGRVAANMEEEADTLVLLDLSVVAPAGKAPDA